MAGRLTLQERAQIAARYEVWGCIVHVQRWWRTIKGNYILKINYIFFKMGSYFSITLYIGRSTFNIQLLPMVHP